jgi:hypothetical protein
MAKIIMFTRKSVRPVIQHVKVKASAACPLSQIALMYNLRTAICKVSCKEALRYYFTSWKIRITFIILTFYKFEGEQEK